MATSNIPDILFDVNYSFPPSEVNTCNVCSEVLKSRTKLADHLLVRHQAKLFWICSKCRVSTSANDRAMRSHYKQCTKDGDDSTPFVSQLLSRSLPEVKSNETVLLFPQPTQNVKNAKWDSALELNSNNIIRLATNLLWNGTVPGVAVIRHLLRPPSQVIFLNVNDIAEVILTRGHHARSDLLRIRDAHRICLHT